MPVFQAAITLVIGLIAVIILIIFAAIIVSLGQNIQYSIRIRAIGITALVVLLSYLIGSVIVNAFGGFPALANAIN